MIRKLCIVASLGAVVLTGCATGHNQSTLPNLTTPPPVITPTSAPQAIKHIVVIFGENQSFDHYFGTYPNATNTVGDPQFSAAAGTSVPNNYVSNPTLISANPNSFNSANNVTINGSSSQVMPFRLGRAQAWTGSQSHAYTNEERAFDNGAMDLFPSSVGAADNATEITVSGANASPYIGTKGLNLGYYDGNTVTAMWNYAQHYVVSDNSYSSTFGPSTQGALNLISGQTNGLVLANSRGLTLNSTYVADNNGGYTLISDADPAGDVCSSTSTYAQMSGKNIGDLLNTAGVTWGWFQGGFDLSVVNSNSTTGCSRSSVIVASGSAKSTTADYVPHHQPFQYYVSTQNLTHARPTSVANIGQTDAANHQYDTHDFTDALAAGVMPAVSFLKAPAFQDAHPGNSDPLDEQAFIVSTVNAIEKSQFWSSTAIIIAYDDSDGWYDHVSKIINGSGSAADVLTACTTAASSALPGADGQPNAYGRCGYGMRQPLMVISPWARKNYLDHTVTDQASILRFIEDNFASSTRITGSFDGIAGSLTQDFDFSNAAVIPNPNVVTLDPNTGLVTSGN